MDEQYYRKPRAKYSVLTFFKKIFRKRSVFVSLLIVIPTFFFITFSSKGVLTRSSLESEKRAMEERVRQAQQEQRRLQEQSKALDNDPKAIEKIAREKYGMIRDGETVYKVRKEKWFTDFRYSMFADI